MLAARMRTAQCHGPFAARAQANSRTWHGIDDQGPILQRSAALGKEIDMASGTTRRRVVLVTGGMGGLGETICTKMADAGYKMAVTYSPSNTRHGEWVAGMKDRGCDMLAVLCDVSDFDSCTRAVDEVQLKVGAVDVLVNNAGITRDMTFKKMDKVNWDAVLRTNLDSLFNMTKQVADGMVRGAAAGNGRCIRSKGWRRKE
jgi:NAD(P)-dependent dehydrogenase (short-subunit alcohol dehydrogenase family)